MNRVFVVEDEAVVALEIQDHLRTMGHEVCGHAARGESALLQIPEVRPDLVLMDINLGTGFSGLEVAERLRAVCDVPIVFLTAHGDMDLTERAGRSETFAFIAKPFEPGVLRANIELAVVRHKSRVALGESEARYRALFEQAAVGVAESDAVTGRILKVNLKYCEIMGYSEEELLALDFVAITHPDDVAAGLVLIQRFGRGDLRDCSVEKRYIRKDGSTVWVSLIASALWAPGEVPTRYMAVLTDITERRRAAAALTASEQRYRRIFEEAGDGIFDVKVDGTIVAVNPAFAQMLGFGSPGELVGRNQADFYLDPAARRRIQEAHAHAETISGIEAVWRRKNGELLNVEFTGRRVRGEQGENVGYHGIVRDVTEQHQYGATQQVLSTGLSRLSGQAFFEAVAAGLAGIVGAEYGFVGALEPGPVPRIRTLAFVVDGKVSPPIAYDLRRTCCEPVFAGRAAVFPENVQGLFPEDKDLVALGVDGYAAAPLFDAKGAVIGHVGVMTRKPITHAGRTEAIVKLFAQRTAAELERQRAESRFSGVFEFAPDAILIVNRAGRIVMANRLAGETFGYGRDEFLGLTIEDLVPESERQGHPQRRDEFHSHATPRRMGARRSRLWARRKDGTVVPVEISLSPLDSDEGPLIVAAVRDVSERVRLEEERVRLEEHLRQAQKMDSVGTLAGGIAHDFNNLLAVIAGSTELARARVARADPVIENLEQIATAASRAATLVDQILAFSRQRPITRVIAAIGPILEEAVRMLRATIPAGIEIALTMGADVPAVSVDQTQIHQVLMNLGTNAWHAIERPTGVITVRLDSISLAADSAQLPDLRPGRYARIRVSDDGVGMDAGIREHMFEPFFTTKEPGKGTGLGLAVAHGIVADHRGAIAVESVPSVGTTFSVYLPEGRGEPIVAESVPAHAARGVGRVLLIDDEELVLSVAQHLLEGLGYTVTTFAKPRDALDAMRGDPRRFDVAITDQSMPGMSGLDLARALSALNPELPIVLTSGNLLYPEHELRKAGVRRFLAKPYTGASLGDAIEAVLNQR